MKKLTLGFVEANAICVILATLAGAIAHLIAAKVSPDLYSIAIGDHVLPSSPVDSWLFGPMLIGAFVSWWFGFIAAPFVFGARIVGSRRSLLRPTLWFVGAAIGAWIALFFCGHDPYRPQDAGVEIFMCLLDRGYWILGLAFAAFAMSASKRAEKGTSAFATSPNRS